LAWLAAPVPFHDGAKVGDPAAGLLGRDWAILIVKNYQKQP
jgi:hypothetical protein